MNGGIHDGINLADKLARVIHGEAGDELLDLYSRQRRHAAVKYVQAQTIANKRLMEERDPDVRRHELRRAAPHRRKPRNRPGLHAPRGAVRQPARRRRGDLITEPHLAPPRAKTHILRHRDARSSQTSSNRRGLRRARFAEFGEHLVQPDRAARRHRPVARRQDRVHHRAGAWPAARRPLSGVRAAGERTHRRRAARAAARRRGAALRLREPRPRARDEREWPESTRQISELRVVIDYQSARRRDAHAHARHRRLSRRMAARPAAARQELRAMVGGDAGASAPDDARVRCRSHGTTSSRRSIRLRRPTNMRRSRRRGCSRPICKPAATSATTLSLLPPGPLPDAGRSRGLAGADVRAARRAGRGRGAAPARSGR